MTRKKKDAQAVCPDINTKLSEHAVRQAWLPSTVHRPGGSRAGSSCPALLRKTAKVRQLWPAKVTEVRMWLCDYYGKKMPGTPRVCLEF